MYSIIRLKYRKAYMTTICCTVQANSFAARYCCFAAVYCYLNEYKTKRQMKVRKYIMINFIHQKVEK